MKERIHTIGAVLLLAVLHWAIAKAEDNLRPTHIDVGGDQDIIEKDVEPGKKGQDTLSHARRSTLYIGGVLGTKQRPKSGEQWAEKVQFATEASGFLYAYPTPKSKKEIESEEVTGETVTRRIEHAIWIVTCRHVVENVGEVGVRLNTLQGASVVYLTAESSWSKNRQDDVAVHKFEGWRDPNIDLAVFELTQAAQKDIIIANRLYEGMPVALLGYPGSRLRSAKRNYPVVQFGYIAQIQGYLEADPNHGVFLIGGAVFPGNSGGPVLIPGGTVSGVNRYFKRGVLMGMVCAQKTAPVATPKGWVHGITQSAHLAVVIPMGPIHKTIEQSKDWNSTSE